MRGRRSQWTRFAQPLGGSPNVAWLAQTCAQRIRQRAWVAQWVTNRAHAPVPPNVCTRQEGAEVERLEIERPLRLRVAIEQHLEATVEHKAIDSIGADTATNAVRCLDDLDLEPCLLYTSDAADE